MGSDGPPGAAAGSCQASDARRRCRDVGVLPARDAERDHRRFPPRRRVVVEDGSGERVAHGIRAIDAIGQHETAGILQDVLRIRQVQGLAVLHERQRLIADQAGERRALQHAIPWRHGIDRRQEP
jgi:hypothetical protein